MLGHRRARVHQDDNVSLIHGQVTVSIQTPSCLEKVDALRQMASVQHSVCSLCDARVFLRVPAKAPAVPLDLQDSLSLVYGCAEVIGQEAYDEVVGQDVASLAAAGGSVKLADPGGESSCTMWPAPGPMLACVVHHATQLSSWE